MIYKAILILLWSSGQVTSHALPTMAYCEIQKDILTATFKASEFGYPSKPYLYKAACMPQQSE